MGLKSFFKEFSNYYKILMIGFLGGILALFIGAFIISVHNIWIFKWPIIITIIGWLSLIKGFWLLVCYKCNQIFSFFSQRSNVFYRIIAIFVILLGIFFIYLGWY